MDSWLGDSFLKYKYLLKNISKGRRSFNSGRMCISELSERNDEYSDSEELKGNIHSPTIILRCRLCYDMHAVFFKLWISKVYFCHILNIYESKYFIVQIPKSLIILVIYFKSKIKVKKYLAQGLRKVSIV